jgi:hypothetical protein
MDPSETALINILRLIDSLRKHECKTQIDKILLRRKFVGIISFAIPNATAIAEIKKFVATDKVLEVGAGLGFWAKLLRLIDIDVLSTDIEEQPISYIPIEKIDGVEAVKKYKDRNVLMMIWPEYKEWPNEVLQNFTGNKFIYIGNFSECASEKFYERCENEWNIVTTVETARWVDFNGDVYLYKKKL